MLSNYSHFVQIQPILLKRNPFPETYLILIKYNKFCPNTTFFDQTQQSLSNYSHFGQVQQILDKLQPILSKYNHFGQIQPL